MRKSNEKTRCKEYTDWGIIAVLSTITLAFSFIPLRFFEEEWCNEWLITIVQQIFGIAAVILLAKRFKIRLFQRPQRLIYALPCLLIAVNNFPFYAYFSGKMQLVSTDPVDYILFTLHCLCVGLFEECIFRGLIFYLLASYFSKDKRGLIKTLVVSSLVFGISHLANLFVGAGVVPTLLQVGYTVLTGALFAFAFIQTKNILIPAFVHTTYNFCGLLFEIPQRGGLGAGVVFDTGTIVIMTVVSVCIGMILLYLTLKYPENERKTLYERLSLEE